MTVNETDTGWVPDRPRPQGTPIQETEFPAFKWTPQSWKEHLAVKKIPWTPLQNTPRAIAAPAWKESLKRIRHGEACHRMRRDGSKTIEELRVAKQVLEHQQEDDIDLPGAVVNATSARLKQLAEILECEGLGATAAYLRSVASDIVDPLRGKV